jgi:hypothetical protein
MTGVSAAVVRQVPHPRMLLIWLTELLILKKRGQIIILVPNGIAFEVSREENNDD